MQTPDPPERSAEILRRAMTIAHDENRKQRFTSQLQVPDFTVELRLLVHNDQPGRAGRHEFFLFGVKFSLPTESTND